MREYLSYVQAQKDYDDLAPVKTDEKGDYYDATLEGTIYPMARDAIAYVIEASVPITDKTGAIWKVEDSTANDGMDIFEVLNSVVCYYAGRYEVTTGYTNGVGNMLGTVDASGNDSINRSNTLWQNIDVIVNKFFPVMATFQGTSEFDSEQFILKDIILGVLDIGDTMLHGGTDGISSFLLKLLNGINEAPVAQTPVHLSVYDVLKDLLNGIFGARYTGQGYTTIIPDASSDSPFDDLLQVGVIAAENDGVIQKVLCNVPEFAGCVGYPDSLLPGLTYAVTAVNSFLGFIPYLSNSAFEPVTAEAADPSMTAMNSGTSRDTSISITNNSLGVNNAYRDGVTNEIVQLDRYYINVKSIKVNDGDASANGVSFTGATSGRLAPGETLTVPMNVTNQQSSSNTNKYTFVYDITDKSGNLMSDEYQDLEVSVYQFMDPIGSWQETVYSDDRIENGT